MSFPPDGALPALSTMWAHDRSRDFADVWRQARDIGFGAFEVNWQVSPRQLQQLRREPGLRVSSVHNPSPQTLVSGKTSEQFSLSALDDGEREQALALARSSLRLAQELGARWLVVHAGRVDAAREPERRLRQLWRNEGRASGRYALERDEVVAVRARHAPAYLEALLPGMRALARDADATGVTLALETRYFYDEIPQAEELEWLLEELGGGVGYWHDVGHAENLERLGFGTHRGWLERFRSRMAGVHLHDLLGLSDHRPPGTGDLDWGMVASLLPATAQRVCEVDSRFSAADLQESLKFLARRGILMCDLVSGEMED